MWVSRQSCGLHSWLGPKVVAWICRSLWGSKQYCVCKGKTETWTILPLWIHKWKRHAFLRFPLFTHQILSEIYLWKRTGVYCDNSECFFFFFKAQLSPFRGRTLSRSSALLSCNFSFLSFSTTHPPPLPLCFLFHFLAPAPTGKQGGWILCSQSSGLSEWRNTRWDGRGSGLPGLWVSSGGGSSL